MRTGLKLTVFTVFTIFITFWLASVIGNIQPFKDTYEVKAVFEDASGVLVGDLVKIAGVDVGKVTGFEVKDGEAIVSMQVEGHIKLPTNVLADLNFRNLLGQRVVNLRRPDDPSEDVLADGGTIPVSQTRPALDVTVVFNNLRPLIQSTNPQDVNTVARAVVEVFEGNEEDLAAILGNTGEVAKMLAARDQRLARLITDLDKVTKVLNRQQGSIRTGLGEFSDFMASLAEVTPTIERTVVQLDTASRKFGGLLARNRSNIDQELSDLALILGVVNENLGPLADISQNLKEILLATARSQSYGRWWNLYVVNLCVEDVEPRTPVLGCRA